MGLMVAYGRHYLPYAWWPSLFRVWRSLHCAQLQSAGRRAAGFLRGGGRMSQDLIVEVRNLSVDFETIDGALKVVRK